jgi:hypothetical protein
MRIFTNLLTLTLTILCPWTRDVSGWEHHSIHDTNIPGGPTQSKRLKKIKILLSQF